MRVTKRQLRRIIKEAGDPISDVLLGNFVTELVDGLLTDYDPRSANRLGNQEEYEASVNVLASDVENLVRKRLGDLYAGDIRLELTFGTDDAAGALGEIALKRKLRSVIKEQLGRTTPEAWADQYGLDIDTDNDGQVLIYLDAEQANRLEMPPGVEWDAQENYDQESWTIYTGEYV